MICLYDSGDCCRLGNESNCLKGMEFCIEPEIGDGLCQEYNAGLFVAESN